MAGGEVGLIVMIMGAMGFVISLLYEALLGGGALAR
jgi:hypothetical protein